MVVNHIVFKMKKGLVGYIFGEKRGIWYRIKKFLGLPIDKGIPIIVSDKVTKDETTIVISNGKRWKVIT